MPQNDSQAGLLDEAGFLASVEALELRLAPGIGWTLPLTPTPGIAPPSWTLAQIAALAFLMPAGALAAALVFHDKVALIVGRFHL